MRITGGFECTESEVSIMDWRFQLLESRLQAWGIRAANAVLIHAELAPTPKVNAGRGQAKRQVKDSQLLYHDEWYRTM